MSGPEIEMLYQVRVERMIALEATNVQGTFNTIFLEYFFNAPPMTACGIPKPTLCERRKPKLDAVSTDRIQAQFLPRLHMMSGTIGFLLIRCAVLQTCAVLRHGKTVPGALSTVRSCAVLRRCKTLPGTEFIVDKLLGSMSRSNPELKVMWEREDGSQVEGTLRPYLPMLLLCKVRC
eukprot:3933395-Rhodomonas_salina.4